ncbi:hypothetical protein LOKG_00042 [Loktanella phage pCB2051-A]|uniref:Uncharacterized protein n=1 Tax=Loktanella phage pCB2051-A TaxID=754044 RepID=M4QRJ9_9CAUD|nr:hypothetical protein LOKG_00042 [Loktanella phage pCB2051-A]AGH31478.1 hypothetical protein LOKG_00042 [Loktanella phage pCB2051-A]
MTTTVNQFETTYVQGPANLSRVTQLETVFVEGTPNITRVAQMEVVYVIDGDDPGAVSGTKQRRLTSLMISGSAA